MVSVDGLPDAHEVSVRAKVASLREQSARVAVELGEAELALEHVAITRATLAAVVAGHGSQSVVGQGADLQGRGAAGPVLVPVRRADLSEAHLPAGYQEVWQVVTGSVEPVRAKQVAVALGLEVSAAKVEGCVASSSGW